jgi:diamine N-acetyltransferase
MSSLRLEPITSANVLDACAIRVEPSQEAFVAPVAQSLAEAYASPESVWTRLIVDGDRVVGFLLAFLDLPSDRGDGPLAGLGRLNVAAGHQYRGYGRFAVAEVAAELRRRGHKSMIVCWAQGEGGPEDFYLRLGFRPTGELLGDQIVAVLDLTD